MSTCTAAFSNRLPRSFGAHAHAAGTGGAFAPVASEVALVAAGEPRCSNGGDDAEGRMQAEDDGSRHVGEAPLGNTRSPWCRCGNCGCFAERERFGVIFARRSRSPISSSVASPE